MGTDVYLEWKGKKEEDSKKQVTGFSIDAGDVGYLRASIGMVEENAVLRLMFPEKYWKNGSKAIYDFKGNCILLGKVLKSYLNNDDLQECLNEKAKDSLNSQKAMGDAIMKAFSQKGFEIEEVKDNEELQFKIMWAKSIMEFFKLGVELQENGQRPYPYISW